MSVSLPGSNTTPKPKLVESSPVPSGTTLVNPYRTTKHATEDLVALASEIQKADSFTRANVGNKLQVIAEQVRFLQEQAKKILEEAQENSDLHHVACNFVKQPGTTYHLYRKKSGQRHFSMISPKEWGNDCPSEFLGSFRLEADQSWTPEEKFEERDYDKQLVDKILTYSSTAAAITDQ